MFRRNFFWYEADKGQGGGGEPPAGDDNTSTGEGKGRAGNGASGDAGGSETTFSQADLDRVAGKVRKEAVSQFIKELGLESPDDLKAIIKAKQEAEDKAKSDLEKAIEERDRAKGQAEAVEARMRDVLLRSEFRVRAVEQVADVELAYLAAQDAGLLDQAEVDLERGKVEGVDKIVQSLLKDKPILKKTKPAPAGTGGSEGGNGSGPTVDRERLKARFGI